MNETIRVFVNAAAVELPRDADVRRAVQTFDAGLAERVAAGSAYVTDGRGIEVEPGAPLAAGAILRVVVSAKRGDTAIGRDGDAHA